MKKKTRTRTLKKVCIICIIAILLSLATQFVNCWHFTGITKNIETNEHRVANMDMSLVSYTWFPISEEGLEFRKYVANPALRYSEEFNSERFSSKKLTQIKDALLEKELLKEKKSTGSQKVDGRVKEEVKDAKSTYYGVLLEIKEYNTNIFDKRFNDTYMAKLGEDHKLVKSYNETVKGIDEQDEIAYNKFINKIVILPAISFIVALAGILVILLLTLKKKKLLLAPGIITIVVGLLNIVNLLTMPLFLLASVKTLIIFGVVYAITTIVGVTTLIGDLKAKKAA